MGFNGVPAGKIVPVYLTDEGDIFSLCFHNAEEVDLIGRLIGNLLDGKVVVNMKDQLNDPRYRLSIKEIENNNKN